MRKYRGLDLRLSKRNRQINVMCMEILNGPSKDIWLKTADGNLTARLQSLHPSMHSL